MLASIGLLIFIKQFPHVFGVKFEAHEFFEYAAEIPRRAAEMNYSTFTIAAVCLGLFFLLTSRGRGDPWAASDPAAAHRGGRAMRHRAARRGFSSSDPLCRATTRGGADSATRAMPACARPGGARAPASTGHPRAARCIRPRPPTGAPCPSQHDPHRPRRLRAGAEPLPEPDDLAMVAEELEAETRPT